MLTGSLPGAGGPHTLAIGALWLLLTAFTGVSYLSADIDSIKGLFQRAANCLRRLAGPARDLGAAGASAHPLSYLLVVAVALV